MSNHKKIKLKVPKIYYDSKGRRYMIINKKKHYISSKLTDKNVYNIVINNMIKQHKQQKQRKQRNIQQSIYETKKPKNDLDIAKWKTMLSQFSKNDISQLDTLINNPVVRRVAPVAAHAVAPVAAPVAVPVVAPVAAPAVAPVAVPAVAPVAVPVVAPAVAPAFAPAFARHAHVAQDEEQDEAHGNVRFPKHVQNIFFGPFDPRDYYNKYMPVPRERIEHVVPKSKLDEYMKIRDNLQNMNMDQIIKNIKKYEAKYSRERDINYNNILTLLEQRRIELGFDEGKKRIHEIVEPEIYEPAIVEPEIVKPVIVEPSIVEPVRVNRITGAKSKYKWLNDPKYDVILPNKKMSDGNIRKFFKDNMRNKGETYQIIAERMLGEHVIPNVDEKIEDDPNVENEEPVDQNVENEEPVNPNVENEELKIGAGNGEGGLLDTEIDDIMSDYKRFIGCYDINQIHKITPTENDKSFGMALFIPWKNDKYEGHWTGIYIDPKHDRSVEYYDSYGHEPPEGLQHELKILIDKMNLPIYLKFKINHVVDQRANSDSCGYMVCKWLMDRFDGIPWKDATKFSNVMNSENDIKNFKYQFKKYGYI